MTSPLRRAAQRVADANARHFGRSQSGITFVLFAMAIVVILGMVAVGIDGARLFDERRQAQNAADHAAVTAAHAMCVLNNAEAAAEAAGVASAGPNGYDDNPASEVTVEYQGSGTLFVATIDATIPATFSHLIGWSSLETGATAEAECQGTAAGSGPGAIYGGGDDCIKNTNGTYGVDASGSELDIFGGVRSNSDVSVGGSNNEWRLTGSAPDPDPFEYVGTMWPNSAPSGNTFDTPDYPKDIGPSVPPPQWPAGWEDSVANPASPANDAYWAGWLAKAAADGHGALVTTKITEITTPGVYYTTHADGMDIGNISAGVTNFTLIARNGPIKVSGGTDNKTFFPADPSNILILSGVVKPNAQKQCSEFGVEISGSNTHWNGILWAPRSQAVMGGSNSASLDGTLIAWSVRINGSNLAIRYNPDLFPGSQQIVLLN